MLASMAYLTVQAFSAQPEAPDPVIQVLAVEERSGGFLVRVRAYNRAGSTAAGLKITGILTRDGQVVERSDMRFDYLPGKSSREGGLFFTRNPGNYRLDLSPTGFEKP